MSFDIEIDEDNTNKVLSAVSAAKMKAMTIIGIKAEKHAKARCPVGTQESTGIKGYRGGTLRDSITNVPSEYDITIGSNVEYAPYVELGTGRYFKAPPAWEQFDVPTPSGIGHSYVRPRPYLRPAISDHLNEYKSIIESELKG